MEDIHAFAQPAFDRRDDLAIERRDLVLLRGAPFRGANGKFRRVALIPDFDVPAGDSFLPRAHPAA